LAQINLNEWIIVGGINAGPTATSNVWKLNYNNPNVISKLENGFQIFPNPSSDMVSIRSMKQIKSIELFQNGFSRLFVETAIQSKIHELSVASLPAGIFLVKTEFADGTFQFQKLVVQN